MKKKEKITRSAKGRAVGPLLCHDWDTPSMEARGRRVGVRDEWLLTKGNLMI